MEGFHKRDLICCPNCECGLWWVDSDVKPFAYSLYPHLIPISKHVSSPKAPQDALNYKTWLPDCVFCKEPTVTSGLKVYVLQRGLIQLYMPFFI